MDDSRFEVVSERQDPEAVERLLHSLPDWFGIEESVVQYVRDAAHKPTYLAIERGNGMVRGAMLVTRHNPRCAEIHLLAIEPEFHRQGLGRALVSAFTTDMVDAGVDLLEVKTQGPSMPDPNYEMTLRFYEAMGFIPVEEIIGLWPENPCLILVKPLAAERS